MSRETALETTVYRTTALLAEQARIFSMIDRALAGQADQGDRELPEDPGCSGQVEGWADSHAGLVAARHALIGGSDVIALRAQVLELAGQLLSAGITPRSALFDGEQYLARHPDVAAAVRERRFPGDAFLHWLLHGIEEGRTARFHAQRLDLGILAGTLRESMKPTSPWFARLAGVLGVLARTRR